MRQEKAGTPGEATAYSHRAGHVRYTDEHGRTGSVWVWAAAIACC